jgi:hypothetical protein
MQRAKRKQAEQAVKHRLPLTSTFPYRRVEAALAKLLDAEDVQPATLRAKLKHLRRSGLASTTPGTGSRVDYTLSDVFQLVLAFDLSQFGIDPVQIVKIVRHCWDEGAGVLFEGLKPEDRDDVLAVVYAHCLDASWEQRRMVQMPDRISLRGSPKSIWVKFVRAKDAVKDLLPALAEGEHLGLFNVSRQVRAVREYLAAE